MSKADPTSLKGGDGFSPEKEPSAVVAGSLIEQDPAQVDMEEYRHRVPLWKRVWQHSLTQMMLLSVQAFCGPAMSDAISGKYHCI